ncbi:hypothetical protein A3D05_00340 [Candidatus Gottesmanbacteria bacterium RIFCSPHIGHO2_02_FULL_40_24]|uniref:Uncharacterized protein n=1 Tax=Candidatus Gottesmanbacteria bacterium RIFCSPHIGHO2_01_FULL_40_15 TaxID=1798376 RepID=A0A1F5Z6L5_9BACT|nr:MAG: hypothetical protein A2777_01650 [Candidatus Gottesmanbacteria bacterium RIFCSPHIGHO2_01_FULL_40_15]OGG18196.1 MAG: hypothetical protein A3D05_00340 [Candidatus Gottesmanbacteria bacterium RIFCSPHIGHO2_02_FULL_40_24]OGG22866.1 MAG: hypothetical protein A3B48_00900 [Candidatus Gottesmanbacteria bacterium RIFCSPLOWO2_01_FULL_40_10]OGG32519.1 MAG: hypothetical protein A3I80_05635 [Candidatus Gottesmanbacteria bacterium RIFCSPLOWO2_02_FULL_40_10]
MAVGKGVGVGESVGDAAGVGDRLTVGVTARVGAEVFVGAPGVLEACAGATVAVTVGSPEVGDIAGVSVCPFTFSGRNNTRLRIKITAGIFNKLINIQTD